MFLLRHKKSDVPNFITGTFSFTNANDVLIRLHEEVLETIVILWEGFNFEKYEKSVPGLSSPSILKKISLRIHWRMLHASIHVWRTSLNLLEIFAKISLWIFFWRWSLKFMRRHYFEILKVKWGFPLERGYQTVYLGFDFPVTVVDAGLPEQHRAYPVRRFARERSLSRH